MVFNVYGLMNILQTLFDSRPRVSSGKFASVQIFTTAYALHRLGKKDAHQAKLLSYPCAGRTFTAEFSTPAPPEEEHN